MYFRFENVVVTFCIGDAHFKTQNFSELISIEFDGTVIV